MNAVCVRALDKYDIRKRHSWTGRVDFRENLSQFIGLLAVARVTEEEIEGDALAVLGPNIL